MKNQENDNEIYSYREGCFLVAIMAGCICAVVLLGVTVKLNFF